MSARTWFTADNCKPPRSAEERRVLNLAARMTDDVYGPIEHLHLVILNTTYRPGMSAQQLFEEAATGLNGSPPERDLG